MEPRHETETDLTKNRVVSYKTSCMGGISSVSINQKAPLGQFRIIVFNDGIYGYVWWRGDYSALREARKIADDIQGTCFIYNDRGTEVYNTISLRSNPTLHANLWKSVDAAEEK